MYYSITGKAISKENYIVVYAGGVGYKIFSSNNTISKIQRDKEITIFTYLNVKEDDLSLFGFATEEELSTFKMLISVSGVGPKVGLAVLSALSPTEFAMAVVTNDFQAITRANGVGKKLAEKIIVELKDKLKGVDLNNIGEEKSGIITVSNTILEEAVNALIVLGYTNYEARQAVKLVATDGDNLEDIIKLALKQLIKG